MQPHWSRHLENLAKLTNDRLQRRSGHPLLSSKLHKFPGECDVRLRTGPQRKMHAPEDAPGRLELPVALRQLHYAVMSFDQRNCPFNRETRPHAAAEAGVVSLRMVPISANSASSKWRLCALGGQPVQR